MAIIPPGLEGLLERQLRQQTEQINDLLKKFTVTTKSDLEAIKKSEDFFANKFDNLAVLTNKLQDENKELRKTNSELQDRCADLEKQCILADTEIEELSTICIEICWKFMGFPRVLLRTLTAL